ncbi:DUF2793 domain-containing protein [Croceicoccus naphthovorans]|uniref:Uncharacterized protein n=1 Tax=Croceicoccus naphthovorans TaxID=1348774 RepID=A0A0G3XDL2_9SPHN|nr:DUF2793 domain-containing protein [Croceicoccus naphthovorans]AKM09277.1 hypothetical protein AB433_03660 [Croceicoccus naphthovorans]MBB3990176.1 hypothetical protein [Croceicoccus naphthovorans]
MTEPVTFSDSTPRFAIPMLYVAQAQKEISLNEAHSRIDALLHPVVEGMLSAEPSAPENGQSWIVGPDGSDAFSGRSDCLASFQEGQWQFFEPRAGMTVFDLSTGLSTMFFNGWMQPVTVSEPAGGPVVDQQARDAIAGILAALKIAGLQ